MGAQKLIRTSALALFIVCACACGEVFKPYEVWYVYPQFKVCVSGDIESKCNGIERADNGSYVGNDRKVRACYEPKQKIIYVQPNDQTALLHELCHATGFPADICDKDYK